MASGFRCCKSSSGHARSSTGLFARSLATRTCIVITCRVGPRWSPPSPQVYQQQLGRVEKAMGAFEAEVEAVRFDLNEAQADPNAALGEDLRSVGVHAYSSSGKTLSGALSKLIWKC